jgi:hypothetical protein
MKHRSAWTMAFAALVLAVAAVGWADDGRRCSNARAAGDWGYTKTGTLFLPTGAAVPFATMGKLTLEANGTLSGVNNGSVNGSVSSDVLAGTFQIDASCTGTATVEVYDQSGNLLRTIGMALVVDDDARELRGLVTSLVLPNGVSLRSVITAQARRVFGDKDE